VKPEIKDVETKKSVVVCPAKERENYLYTVRFCSPPPFDLTSVIFVVCFVKN